MKAILSRKYGSPDVLRLEEIEKPIPNDNQVLVKIYATSINVADLHILKGKPFLIRLMGFGVVKPKFTILGSDMAGKVEAVGKNITQFQPGDEVFGSLSRYGRSALAEYVCVTEEAIIKTHTEASYENMASLPVSAVTALQALRDAGKIESGQEVLIYGASGGVGTFAVQIAKSFGCSVTGVCSKDKIEMVRSLGADHVIDYTTEDFTKNNKKYDLIVAVNGSCSIMDYRRALKPQGIYVMVGGSGAQMIQALFMGPLFSIFGQKKMGNMGYRPNKKDLSVIRELLDSGKIVPVIDKKHPLSETAEAFKYIEKGHARGKVIIEINQN